jgi:hypothetical protein
MEMENTSKNFKSLKAPLFRGKNRKKPPSNYAGKCHFLATITIKLHCNYH